MDIDQGIASLDDSEFSDEDDDEWNKTGDDATSDTDGYDTVYTSSESRHSNDSSDEDDVPLPPPPTAEELAELDKISEVSNSEQILGTTAVSILSEIQEESTAASVLEILDQEDEEDSLPKEILTNSGSTASTELQEQSTAIDKEELLKKAATTAASHAQARKMSKIASHQIKHRIFAREVLTAAVAAGDEADEASETISGYSIWSSGTLGSHKQKSKADSSGYSSKITGGTIGADINLENDLLLGASFSKFSSRVKHHDQDESSDLRTSGKSTRAKYDTHILSLYGLSSVSPNISISAIGSAGLSKDKKVRSKLLSFESHLNYRVELPRAVTLIPHIGLRYEYEKANSHKEQIASNLSYVQLKLAIGQHFYDISQIGITFYDVKGQEWIYRSAEEFVHKFWYVTKHGTQIANFGSWLAHSASFEVLGVFGLTMSGITIFFWYRGIKTIGSQKLRGMDYVEASEFTKILTKEKVASNIKFAGLPIVKDSERQHILITGTTGTGKTNMLNELLPQIRSKSEKAIIVDMTGSYVDRFYDQSRGDIILNPFYLRTSNWLPLGMI